MVMRMTTDFGLLRLNENEVERCYECIAKLTSVRWSMAYSRSIGAALLRRPSRRSGNHLLAKELESALEELFPDLAKRLTWAWTSDGTARFLPTGEINVLFEADTTQERRRKILSAIPGIKVETHPAIPVQQQDPEAQELVPEGFPVPGFSERQAPKVLRALDKGKSSRPKKQSSAAKAKLRVPVARVMLPSEQKNGVFEIAARINALPGVLAATPDIHIFGRDIRGKPQQVPPPVTAASSLHERNLVDRAWTIIDQPQWPDPPNRFLTLGQRVAVIDFDFFDHPEIRYDLIGYDAADDDHDPMAPEDSWDDNHGAYMAGIIGGMAQANSTEVGIAPGATIVPIRPSWATDDDFTVVDGQAFFQGYEEFLANYTRTWVNALIRLWILSHDASVTIANMSLSIVRNNGWNDAGLDPWFSWWLYDGNFGNGVFVTASAGNNPDRSVVAWPASHPRTFAVGWGNFQDGLMKGNTGSRLDVVVDEGLWPRYKPNGDVSVLSGGFGSSGSSATVAGIAAMMQSFGTALQSDDIKVILRRTTRKAPGQEASEDANGHSSEFGFGFVNAYYAIDVARKYFAPAAELLRVRFRRDSPPRAFVQARRRPWMDYAGKRTGMFWALWHGNYSEEQLLTTDQLWIHDRNPKLKHIDQAIDVWGFPFGEITVVGDFDRDGMDEIAVQLDATDFWPEWTEHPANSFLVYKHNEASDEWEPMGQRSPDAVGIASPQVIFPSAHPARQVFANNLSDRQWLVAHQDRVLNAFQYDANTDQFVSLPQIDFAPDPVSDQIAEATGVGTIFGRRILKISPLKFMNRILVIGSFWKGDPFSILRNYVTACVLTFDYFGEGVWKYVPLSTNLSETHIVLESHIVPFVRPPNLRPFVLQVEGILVGDFTLNRRYDQAVVHMTGDRVHYLSLHRPEGSGEYAGYSVHTQDLDLPGRISQLQEGVCGFVGDRSHLVWLSDASHGNRVRFLTWNVSSREWQHIEPSLWHGRRDNEAIDVAVADILGRSRNIIALLMREPHQNTFQTYRWLQGRQEFDYLGII